MTVSGIIATLVKYFIFLIFVQAAGVAVSRAENAMVNANGAEVEIRIELKTN